MQAPKAFNPTAIATFQFPGLVNRKRVIATLEDKANLTGFAWTRPHSIPKGFVEHKSKNGDFLYYACTLPITIKDVDGTEKKTVRTTFYEQDKRTQKVNPAPQIGNHVKGKASRYHGTKSANWKQAHLTLAQIIETLNAGYAFAPGLFDAPAGESQRAAEYCEHRQIVLLDGDEWGNVPHAPPANSNQLLELYPDLPKDFYWFQESISSRSSLKPELRTRLMLIPPRPIYKGETDLWETVIDAVVQKYPFIARGVGVDKVRLSFGNARPECESRILGGFVSDETFAVWEQIASERREKAEALRLETEKQKTENRERRAAHTALNTELKKRGHQIASETYKDPLVEFCETDAVSLLNTLGLATQLDGNSWNWHDSSPGRSFELKDGIIKPFSNMMQTASPEPDGTNPVNAHRYILYALHKLDITHNNDKTELRRILADLGYGTHPDQYKAARKNEKVTAVKEGLLSPLALRTAAQPLPIEKERPDRVLRTLEQNAPVLTEAFANKAAVIGLRAGTGEGKTEGAIAFAVDGGAVAMNLNTIPLAEQVYKRFDTAETFAFLWRSRWYQYADKNRVTDRSLQERIRAFERGEILCIKPHLCKASQARGIPAPVAICSTCEVKEQCGRDGYLSQTAVAQNSQVLCISHPNLFIDPASKGFFQELSKGQPTDRICVIDEAKVHKLFIKCALPKIVLQQWVKNWRGKELGIFAETVLDMLEIKTRAPYEIAELVNAFDPTDLDRLSRQASRYRVGYEKIDRGYTEIGETKPIAEHLARFDNGASAYVAVDFDAYERFEELGISALQPMEIKAKGHLTLTPSQAFRFGVFTPESEDAIKALPRLWEQSDWTPFQQLKIFAERYQRQADAPIWYQDDILNWVIPPIVHSRSKRVICMSATLQREGFDRAFDSIPAEKRAFIETQPTLWVAGATAYQVRSGAYPRTSILDYDDQWNPVGISKTGNRFIGLIESEIERDRQTKHVIITFKRLAEFCGEALKAKHANLTVLTFSKMEGLDFKENGLIFWILGCPEIDIDVLKQHAQIVYGNDTEPLNYERDPDTREYVDKRVQLCWQAEVVGLMQQAIGRARLNRLANTAIVFSNILIPDFTGRAIGFVPEDLEVADGLSHLTETSQKRVKAERNAIPDETKTAREKEQDARTLKKQRKDTAFQLYDSGVSPNEISQRLEVSRRTVFNWIEKRGF